MSILTSRVYKEMHRGSTISCNERLGENNDWGCWSTGQIDIEMRIIIYMARIHLGKTRDEGLAMSDANQGFMRQPDEYFGNKRRE